MLASGALLLTLLAQSDGAARTLEIEFAVAGDPQIAVWLEDRSGNFMDTIMVTKLVGTFGLGNRPGRPDFGSAFLFPYGRREMALPVWAHRRGVTYDRMVFQDCKENWLGWHESGSSQEPFYCRPMTEAEMSVDAISCPTTRFATDKGIPLRLVKEKYERGEDLTSDQRTFCQETIDRYDLESYYPPRNDIGTRDPVRDWEGLGEFQTMNDLDAVSQPTPPAGERQLVTYGLPSTLTSGDYVVWVEVNQEWDMNRDHSYAYYVDTRLDDYGTAHIGQPSVVWQVPVTVTSSGTVGGQALDYAGYGSVTGEDGTLNPADGTISTDVPSSGANRLLVLEDNLGSYRVRVGYDERDCEAPVSLAAFGATEATFDNITVSFQPSGLESDDLKLYEIRYIEGQDAISTADDFEHALPIGTVQADGQTEYQSVLAFPRPDTAYTLAIRAVNECQRASSISTINVRTAQRIFKTVDACFIATAAYGSLFEADVTMLRRFRDRHLMTNEVGRQAVALYYALSPPIADFIRSSEGLRALTRVLLSPAVEWVRALP